MAKIRKKFDKGIRLKPTDESTGLSGELSVSSVDNKLKATLESYADYSASIYNVGDKVKHTDGLNYVCIQITTGAEDPSNASFWTVTERSIVTEDQTQTITNKTIDATDATGTNTVSLDASDATYDNTTSGLDATDAQAAIDENDANIDAHIADAIDAHDASAISFDAAGNSLVASEAQAAIVEVAGRLDNAEQATADHLADAIDSHDSSSISYDKNKIPSGLLADNVQDAIDEIDADLDAHIADAVDAHDASAISNIASGNLAATDVQAALDELQTDVDTRATGGDLTAHIGNTTDAHDSSAISVVQTGNLTSTDVQSALEELQTDIDNAVSGAELTAHTTASTAHGTTSAIVGKDDAQTLTNKTMESALEYSSTTKSASKADIQPDPTTLGSDATLFYTNILASHLPIMRLENGSLVSVAMLANPEQGKEVTIINATGNDISIRNDVGATAANRILTGTKADIVLKDEASIVVKYDSYENASEGRWMVIGGVGAEGGGDTDVDVMFVDNFERTTIADYAVTGAATITETALDVINGTKSLKLDHTADVTAKRTIAVPNKFRGKSVTIELDINSNATSGNVTATVVDETNVVTLVNADSVEPFNGVGSEKRYVSFEIPETCASLSFEFDGLEEAGAITIIDDIQIEKVFQVSTQTITDELLKENEFSARIANNGTGSITSQNSSFIQSVNRTATGKVTLVFATGFFTEIPSIVATVHQNIDSNGSTAHIINVTANGAEVWVKNDAVAFVDRNFDIEVSRQGADYDANLIRRVETKDTFAEIVVEQDRDISEINEFSASFDGGAGASVSLTSSNASFIDSVVFNSTGNYTVNFVAGLFTVAPVVTPSVISNSSNRIVNVDATPTTNSVVIETSAVGTLGNEDFMLNVSRQGSDVYNKTLTRIKTNPNQKIKIPSSEMRLEGSTTRGTGAETFTLKFDSLTKSIGGDLLLDNSNGTIITCKKDGLLSIACGFNKSGVGTFFATRNQTVNTAIPVANEVLTSHGASSSGDKNLSVTATVKAGDKIRISGDSAPSNAASNHLELYFQEQEIQVGVSNILPKFSETDACVSVYGQNGNGSINDKIPRLSIIDINNPNGKIAYTDTETEGNAFEILEDGTYNVSVSGQANGASFSSIGLSLNSSNLTTDIYSLSKPEHLGHDTTYNINFAGAGVSVERNFNKGDILRLHTNGLTGINNLSITISQVGKPNITAVDVTPFADLPLLDTEYARYNTHAGFGSSASFIPYLVNEVENSVSKFGVIDNSSVNGWSFTATKKCTVSITYAQDTTTTAYMGFSLNSTELSTGIPSINIDHRLSMGCSASTVNVQVNEEITMNVGDVIRPHVGVATAGTASYANLNISITGQSNQIVTEQDSNLSGWTPYTPTFNNMGTVTEIDVRYKQVGDVVRIKGRFKLGAVPVAETSMTLPSGLNVDTSDISTLANTERVGLWQRMAASSVHAAAYVMFVDANSSTDKIYVAINQTTAGFTRATTNTIGLATEPVFIDIEVPIAEYSAEAKTLVAITENKISYSPVMAINTTYTIPHGLGKVPNNYQYSLEITNATAGYSVGDEIIKWVDGWTGVVDSLLAITMDATNFYVRSSNTGVGVHNKSTGANTNLLLANFRVKFRYK